MSIDKLYPKGWLMYCGVCDKYIKQSDPQNSSIGKTVVIDENGSECENCKVEAQELMGRLGVKGEIDDKS